MLFKSNVWVSSIFAVMAFGTGIYAWRAELSFEGASVILLALSAFVLMIGMLPMLVSDKACCSITYLSGSYMSVAIFMALIAVGFTRNDLIGTTVFALITIGISAIVATFVEESPESMWVRTAQSLPIIGVLFEVLRRRWTPLARVQ